jgi:transcriptional regulator with XRE-family HTH domain
MARRRITVPKAAALTGMSPAYLYRRLNGETALDVDDLARLAAILNVPVRALFPADQPGLVTGGITSTSGLSAVVNGQVAA